MITSYLLLILVTIGSALGCGYIAGRRNASVRFWVICGLIFGPFALPFVLLANPVIKEIKDGEGQ